MNELCGGVHSFLIMDTSLEIIPYLSSNYDYYSISLCPGLNNFIEFRDALKTGLLFDKYQDGNKYFFYPKMPVIIHGENQQHYWRVCGTAVRLCFFKMTHIILNEKWMHISLLTDLTHKTD